MNKKLQILRNTSLLLTSLIVWIIILELATSFYFSRWGTPIDKVQKLLNLDPHLGWRQKPNLSTHFLGKSISTNEGGFREPAKLSSKSFVFLGPSSTFGWGVEHHETYPEQFKKVYNAKARQKINVYNAGQIGFSSWQGRKLFNQELKDKLPFRHLIVSYGVNDIDHHRFFFQSQKSDIEEFSQPKNSSKTNISNIFRYFQFLSLAPRLITFKSCGPGDLTQSFLSTRVSLSRFKENLSSLISSAKTSKTPVTLITTPYKYSGANNVKTPSEQELNSGLELYSADKFLAGSRHFSRLNKRYPFDSKTLKYMLVAAVKLKNCDKANELLSQIIELEPMRIFNDIQRVNATIENLSLEMGTQIIPAHLLLKSDPQNFVDPVHFSAQGNLKIAKELYEQEKGTLEK